MDWDDVFWETSVGSEYQNGPEVVDNFQLMTPEEVITKDDIVALDAPLVEDLSREDAASDQEASIPVSDTQQAGSTGIIVEVPELPIERQIEYLATHSDVLEFVYREIHGGEGDLQYAVQFTDGREEVVRTMISSLFSLFSPPPHHSLRLRDHVSKWPVSEDSINFYTYVLSHYFFYHISIL